MATIASLEERVRALEHEIAEHKRLCEAHEKEMDVLKSDFIRAQAAVSPWLRRLEAAATWVALLLLAYVAAKVGLKP